LERIAPSEFAVSPWEFESTLSQLATLADLQADLLELLGKSDVATAAGSRETARKVLRGYLGNLGQGLEQAVTGKIRLALSGRGVGASVFYHAVGPPPAR